MSELIARQAAIDTVSVGAELLRRVLDEVDLVGAEREKYEWGLGLIESCISDIKELPPVQPEPQWIPVSERLPEVGQTIIAQCRANIIKTLKLDSDGDWYQDAEHCYMSGFVVAWMPLPEAYNPNK